MLGRKLTYVQLERNQIEGVIDMRQLPKIDRFFIQDNQISGFNFGKCNDAVDKVCLIYELNAENNKIEELSIENCGQIRILKLKGNPIERLTLLNNSKQDGGMQWMYLFKAQETFSLSWASAAEAKGERHFNVEEYWWRVFSSSNADENKANKFTDFEGGWVENGPIVQALKDGVKVTCWTYHGESGGDAHAVHTHEGGSTPCNYPDYNPNN